MAWVRGFVVLLSMIQAGYMLFDGVHALALGDYLTPKGGPFQGQLGPWAGLVEAAGISPRSTLMKCIFVLYGSAWLAITFYFARGRRWGRAAMLLIVTGSLWWIGAATPLALAQLLLLILLPANRPIKQPPA